MGYMSKPNKKDNKIMVKMSKQIIDFSHSGVDMKPTQPIKATQALRPPSFGTNTPAEFKKSRQNTRMSNLLGKKRKMRPKSGKISRTVRRNKGLSRMTTQNSYSSSKLGFKNSMSKTRESHIKYLAENKDK